MATINGTSGSDTIQGTADDDQIQTGGGDDRVSGEGANDLIDGGAGNDVLYGDAGVGTAPGNDATPVTLSFDNRVSSGGGDTAKPGDKVVYRDVATLTDGTPVYARLVLVSTSNENMPINLSGGEGFEILLNAGSQSRPQYGGETASFRLEFFNPNTGLPVSLNSTATFNDLDRNSDGDQESVTLDADSFTAFATSDDSALNVTTQNGTVTATGTQQNDPNDQDSWFSGRFEDREFIEFTLETRTTQSGFTLSGDLIDEPVEVPIVAGDDTLFGGLGDDTLLGQGGDDNLDGGVGSDKMSGGEGHDTLTVGGGDDLADGGQGSDLINFTSGGNHTIVGGEDADGLDNDVLNLTGLDKSSYKLIKEGPESGRIEFQDSRGNITGTTTYSEIEDVVICFTPDTRIATRRGEIPVQQLKVDDLLITRDNGLQPVRWIGRRNLSRAELVAAPRFHPIMIRAGALGNNLPQWDMVVSPNHRILITSNLAEVMFLEREVLVAAKHLVGLDGVNQIRAARVSYIHILFDQHEVVLADGAWAESFQPGEHSMAGILPEQRDEVLTLFPELKRPGGLTNYAAARRLLRAHEARILTSETMH
ncbi:Hemolysin-type calcium-binding repeat-containing protein [Sulfitobacter marinus]|uniref:Hemolysin-type calcium-binding repeat-containing protein n=1 Tax=Sulfitobacter marinus TaxID=394264 RepID=A0A1I6QQI8_9RHOB|nr:Hint domain-containing protein [Sulfitobacter marinus]SFS54622.1 Hemolysin-type calcium-binding repeat-containing protein [Sulfitobacter marinus]